MEYEKDTRIMIDSSAWIEFFRGNENFSFIADILSTKQERIRVNEVVLFELLPSMRKRKEKELIELINQLQLCTVNIDWKELMNFQLANLQNGNNKMPLADLVIAQNCIQNDMEIATVDRHFTRMSGYLPLKIYGGP